jgi:hypothetical protein
MNELELLRSKIIKNIYHHRKIYGDFLTLIINVKFLSDIVLNQTTEVSYKIFLDISNKEKELGIEADYLNNDRLGGPCSANILRDYGPGAEYPFSGEVITDTVYAILHDLIFEKHLLYIQETTCTSFEEFIQLVDNIDLVDCDIECLNYMNNSININIL